MKMTDEIRVAEEMVLLLLGINKSPLNGEIHLQKEIFLLTKANPKLQQLFNFKKHIFGPYSQLLADIVEEPMYHDGSFMFVNKKIKLSLKGQKEFKLFENENKSDKKFLELQHVLFLIRSIYDKLNVNEFLFLVYSTYSDYLEKSAISGVLFEEHMKKKLSLSLFSKGIITELRYKELMEVRL